MAKPVKFYELRHAPHNDNEPSYFAENFDTLVNSLRISYSRAGKIDVAPAMTDKRWNVYIDDVSRMVIVQHDGMKLEQPEHL